MHGSPLGEEDLANTKKKLGLDPTQKFHVPEQVHASWNNIGELSSCLHPHTLASFHRQVRNHYSKFVARGNELEKQWQQLFESYAQKYPELASEFKRRVSGDLPEVWLLLFVK